MSEFATLHHHDTPLLLPNAWDHGSAALLAEAGFRAIATTSMGVSAAAGHPDSAGTTREETLRVAKILGGDPRYLLSVDAEDGYGDDPAAVVDYVHELAAAGAVGINLEDRRPDGTLTDPAVHAAKIAALKNALPDLFVNARTDTYWLERQQDETLPRLKAYQDAGADGVFLPGLTDSARISELAAAIELPLNVLYRPGGPSVAELGELGVRRVSLGGLLYRVAIGAALQAATAVRGGNDAGQGAPSYADVQRLSLG